MTATASLPDTRLPRQIRERMARIEAMKDQPTGDPEVPIAAEVPPQPGEAPGANPTPPSPTGTPNPDEPKPELRPFHDPALKTDPRADDPTYWRQRLSVLQGRMRDERQEFETRESALRAEVNDLKAQVKQLQQATKPAAVDLSTLFTPEQLDALGEDQAQAIASATFKAAQQQVDAALTEQRTAAETQRAQSNERAMERQKRQFFDDLEERVPDWVAVNARQDWLEWLRETDPRTGRQRQAALTASEQAFDAQGVAAVFDAFKAAQAPRPTPPVAAPRAAGATAAAPAANADLSMLPPGPDEIREHYKRCSVNGGKGYPETERVAFEKRLKLLQPS